MQLLNTEGGKLMTEVEEITTEGNKQQMTKYKF